MLFRSQGEAGQGGLEEFWVRIGVFGVQSNGSKSHGVLRVETVWQFSQADGKWMFMKIPKKPSAKAWSFVYKQAREVPRFDVLKGGKQLFFGTSRHHLKLAL